MTYYRTYLFDVNDIHHGDRQIGTAHELQIRLASPQLGGEDFRVSFTAEENRPLVKDAQALHRHRRGTTQIRLKGHRVEKAHIHRVEAPIEAHRLHVYIHVQQLCTAALYRQRAVDDIHILHFRIETQVFNAVFIGRHNAFDTFGSDGQFRKIILKKIRGYDIIKPLFWKGARL